MATDTNVGQIVRTLKKDGVVCLQSAFNEQTVEQLRSEAEAAFLERQKSHRGRRTARFRLNHGGRERFPTVARVYYSNCFKQIVAGYDKKCRFTYKAGALVDHASGPNNKLSDIHFDTQRWLKFMIYLSDIDKESAAFRYCLGSHTTNSRLRNRFLLMGGKVESIPNVAGPEENPTMTDIEGPRGTLIVFDTDGFHTAGILKAGKERCLIRAGIMLSGWYDNKMLRSAVRRNPLRFLSSSIAPKGRLVTRGTSRARHT